MNQDEEQIYFASCVKHRVSFSISRKIYDAGYVVSCGIICGYCIRNKAMRQRKECLRAARKRGTHTAKQWENLQRKYGNVCVRCGASGPLHKDHIRPISHGGSDSIRNIQPLCAACNFAKNKKTADYRPKTKIA